MTTEERLEKVEQELARAKRLVRRLMIAALACIGVLVVSWTEVLQMTAQGKPHVAPQVLARSFILVDDNDKPRAMLFMAYDTTGLTLLDEKGKPRAMLATGKNTSTLALNDENGKIRAAMGVASDGPGLTLFDENGKGRGAKLSAEKGGTGLILIDEKGKPIITR
jgi:hypothetical protein